MFIRSLYIKGFVQKATEKKYLIKIERDTINGVETLNIYEFSIAKRAEEVKKLS